MNVPSYVKSNRVAITSLLAMARSTALIEQVCGAYGVIVIIYYHYCVVFVSAIIALCVYVFLYFFFIFECFFFISFLLGFMIMIQATVSGKRLQTGAGIKTTHSTTMLSISTLSVARVNTRKRSISAKENLQHSMRGSVRIASKLTKNTVMTARNVRGCDDNEATFI